MGKIKTSLLISFGTIIGLTVFLSSFIVFAFLNIEDKYRAISDNMILEYRITETFSKLVDGYASLLQNPSNTASQNQYNEASKDLDSIFIELDRAITISDIKDQYLIVKNMSMSIKAECDQSLKNLSANDFSQGAGIYDRAIRSKDFVKENTTNLILKELKYSMELQKSLSSLRRFTLISSIILIIVIVSGSGFFAFSFSNKLSDPIVDLTKTTENISKGNLDSKVSDRLLKEEGEIGTLSNSFNVMVQTLKNKIDEINKSKVELEKSNEEIKKSNQELENVNKIMVGRELKMIELKKEIETLRAKAA